jgi:hypothetical protein
VRYQWVALDALDQYNVWPNVLRLAQSISV